MKKFNGRILFLDRSDINTDEIIPAKYLTEITKEALKPYLFEDLQLAGFNPLEDVPSAEVVMSRENFGCGSSREHAPWALEVNGINLVIGESFARIFRQNMYNCGMMALELPADVIDSLFETFGNQEAILDMDLENCTFDIKSQSKSEKVKFVLSDYDKALISAGGWVEYADQNY